MPKYPGRIVSATPPSVSLSGASGVWTLEEVAQYEQAGTWPVGVSGADPNFNQTVLLLHGDGTNGAQNNTFLDSSSNNFTITRNPATGPNAPTQGTFSPFSAEPGKWGNYFDGNADFLTVPSNAAFQFGTGDFTIECWVNKPIAANSPIIDARGGAAAAPYAFYVDGSNFPYFYDGAVYTSSVAITNNQWNHIAVVRTSGTLKIFVNGVQGYSNSLATSLSPSATVYIGGQNFGSSTAYTTGYISNLRVVKGRAVYTSAFTPPIVPLGATSGGTNPPQGTETSLLTCQSNRFVDNGGLATKNTITRNGDVRVTPFSPFAPSAAYSAGTNGGSGYFDGTGDFLSSPNNSAIHVLGSDFCLEGWFYLNTAQSNRGLYSTYAFVGGVDIGYFIRLDTTFFRFFAGSAFDRTYTFTQGQWYHFAVTNSGGTGRIFINGEQQGATFSITATTNSTETLQVGQTHSTTNSFNGYLSSFRIVKGSPVYTSNFTPPASPLTAIANTSFLCNFTNAGIIDNTGKNNLETVGNAQIDTTTKKFGTGSMKFDGTGDYITVPARPDLDLTTGNFTIECWFYYSTTPPSGGGYDYIWGIGANNVNGLGLYIQDGTPKIWNGGPSPALTTTGSISATTWYHIAVVRSSGTLTVYLNGTSIGSVSLTSNISGGGAVGFNIARWSNASDVNEFPGFIDDLRITKGVARYPTEPFPTAPFPDF